MWRSDWLEAEAYLDALTPDARVILLELLSSSADVRAEAIGRLHGRVDASDLSELLILLEEKEWARQWFVARLGGESTG